MPEYLLPSLLLQMLIVGYTPGPANIFSLTMSIKYGKKPAFKMWLGLLTGFSIAAVIMSILTHFIGLAIGSYVIYLKYLGAAYILFLAYKVFAKSGKQQVSNQECTFLSGMIIQMTNAKMLLFELTVFSVFVIPYSDKIIDLLEVSALLLIAGPIGNLVWLILGGYLSRFFTKYGRQVDIASAISLVLCAVYIAFR